MLLPRADLIERGSPEALQTLLGPAREDMLEAFEVPSGDRCQVMHEHPAAHLIAEDTDLGIFRTDERVVLQATTRPRRQEMKVRLRRPLCQSLKERCGIAASDIVISLITRTDADWSLGHGRSFWLESWRCDDA